MSSNFEVVSYTIKSDDSLCFGEAIVEGDCEQAFSDMQKEVSRLGGNIDRVNTVIFKYFIPAFNRLEFGSLLEAWYGEEDYDLMARVVNDCSRLA